MVVICSTYSKCDCSKANTKAIQPIQMLFRHLTEEFILFYLVLFCKSKGFWVCTHEQKQSTT